MGSLRPLAASVALVLALGQAAPGCGGMGDRDPPTPDSKRSIRKGLIAGTLIVKDGEKVVPAPAFSCLDRVPGSPGVQIDPETHETYQCEGFETPPDLPTLDAGPGEKFRVLIGRGTGTVTLHRVPEGFRFPARANQMPTLELLARGVIQDKGGSRWRFELPAPVDYSRLLILVSPPEPYRGGDGYEVAVYPGG